MVVIVKLKSYMTNTYIFNVVIGKLSYQKELNFIILLDNKRKSRSTSQLLVTY